MNQGLKESVPIVVKASPEVTLTGQWLADKVSDCITSLGQVGFKVKGIVADNHSNNVSAFNILQTKFPSGLLIQNIRTIQQKLICFLTMFISLKTFVILNCKKFVFPAFSFSLND